ncbi:MAG: hypothetical protein NC827_10030 [Candidatus Omnitrophica bacterium]|nr:hypothetical protein [Candidatus Omnitrophota bacterium]
MKKEISIQKIKKKDFTPWFLSKWFTKFYSDEPWNEYLKCTSCDNGYGSKAAFGIKKSKEGLKNCPFCGNKLELFWSPVRASNYFLKAYQQKNFLGFKALDKLSNIIGWIWGYEIDSKTLLKRNLGKTFYIDVICILPNYRHLPIIGSLYLYLLDEIEKRKFSFVVSRTHLKAEEIKNLLKLGEFKETNIFSKENPERNFWIKTLKLSDYNIEYSHIYTNETFGDLHKKSVVILKNLIKKLKKRERSYTLSVLIDDYTPTTHLLNIKEFLLQLKNLGAYPDYVMYESKLANLKELLLKNIMDWKTKNSCISYIKRKNKLPCSFLVAIWYLARLGRLPIEPHLFLEKNSKRTFAARQIISILPKKYQSTSEVKAQKIIENSIFRNEIGKIKYIYY